MADYRISDLTPQMTEEIAQAAILLQRVFAPQGSWATLAEAEQEVAEMLDPARFVRVALAQGQVIGWIGGIPEYGGNVWELHPLLVAPEWQRRGVGRALVADFEARVQERGGLTVQLGTDDVTDATSLSGVDLYRDTWRQIAEIRNLNGHPFEFYQKQGYTIIGVMPDANGRGRPDIYMGKRIG
ncbi:MAG: GNAT family N-acetyltransferase [Caldilineaceae bacterium]|nr:GNAT family N-acetyltransferase [Caldilineaceae bacterium]HRJ40392.1 GNAT family N-acetyltransferase [Caldilineaceae bacterium]